MIAEIPANYLHPDIIKDGVQVLKPEQYSLVEIRQVVQLLYDHQDPANTAVSFEKGLIFTPPATGKELYYPTKRPQKGKGLDSQ